MVPSKSRLPAIAIALAIVAAGMLSAAIVMRSRKVEESAPPAGAPSTPTIDATTHAFEGPPDAEDRALASDAGVTCVPCQGCSATTCRCNDGSVVSSYHCRNGCCLSATETCDSVCTSRNGTAPP